MRAKPAPHSKGLIVNEPLGFKVWHLRDRNVGMPKAHSHADLELNFLKKGWLTYVYGGQVVTLKPGDLAVFWGSVPHQAIDGTAVVGVWATFTLPMLLSWKLPARLDERLLKGEFVKTSCAPGDLEFEGRILERWVRDKESSDPQAHETVQLELEARLRRLALETKAPAKGAALLPPDPGIERALAFLNQNYRRGILSSEVAAVAGWHEKYLMRAFKRTTQMSMGEYLMRLRVSHAQWLLISSDKSMLEIAYESGFQSVAPFYQAFRRVSPEATPLQFRKQALGTQR